MFLPTLILFLLGLAMADDPTPAPIVPPEAMAFNGLRCYHFATAAQAKAEKDVQEGKWMILMVTRPQNEGQAASHRDAVAAVTAEMSRLDEVIAAQRANLERIEADVLFQDIPMPALSEEFCSALVLPAGGQ